MTVVLLRAGGGIGNCSIVILITVVRLHTCRRKSYRNCIIMLKVVSLPAIGGVGNGLMLILVGLLTGGVTGK